MRTRILLAATTALATATPAFASNDASATAAPAAETAAAAQPETAADAETTGAEVIVTAQKRSERQQDVPVSVSVVQAEDMTKQGIVRFTDYAARVPGLSLTSARTGQAQVTLRGITTGSAQPASATAYYIDEAPVGSVNAYTTGSSTTPDLDPADLAQIEVLKGPQGTLYGAGAVGGLLKFVTARPSLNTFSARFAAGINDVAHGGTGYSMRGVVNMPLIDDKLTLRAAGFYRRDAGYIDNVHPLAADKDINRAKVYGGRFVLSMGLAANARLDLSAILQNTRAQGNNTVDVDAATLRPAFGGFTVSRPVEEDNRTSLRLYNGTLKVDAGAFDLVSSTTFQRIKNHAFGDASRGFGSAPGLAGAYGFAAITVLGQQGTETERWVQEFRASADGLANGLLDVQAGFYYTYEDDLNEIPDYFAFNPTTGAPIVPIIPALAAIPIVQASLKSDYEEYSLFGNVRVHLSDQFDILGGLRWSKDKQNFRQDYYGLILGGARLINVGSEKGDITTWMVSPRFKITPDVMLYGRAATGYRPGGPNAVPFGFPAPTQFAPDQLTQYEVGLKTSFLDRRVTFDTALFYTNWKDIQVQTSAGGYNFLVNGGKARSQGGEATLRVRPATGMVLGANLAYTDAKLTTDAPAAGGLDGDRLPYVPKWSGSLHADYETPIGGGDMTFNVGGNINFVSNRITDYANRLPRTLDGYTTIDLRAGIGNDQWNLSVFAKNLTDKRAINVIAQQGLAPTVAPGQIYSASYIQPRTIGAEASIRF